LRCVVLGPCRHIPVTDLCRSGERRAIGGGLLDALLAQQYSNVHSECHKAKQDGQAQYRQHHHLTAFIEKFFP
jgi:hypothetical protein